MPHAEPVVYLVDDDDAMRDALELLLAAVGLRTASYASAEAFLADCDPSEPGCIVLDIRMPGMDGTDLQDMLAARQIGIPIVFLTGHGDMTTAVRGMRHGAVNFLAKPFKKDELLDSVREAISHDADARRRECHRTDAQHRMASLTSRERQVLDLVLLGHLNKQIAAKLGIAERTVEDHRRHIMEKTGAGSVSELTRLAMAAASTALGEAR